MTIELGGNIKLTGFKEVDSGSMVILKKMVGNYARKMSEKAENFQGLEITMKEIHKTEEGHQKFEVRSKVHHDGKLSTSELTDKNIFVAVDGSLQKVWHVFSK